MKSSSVKVLIFLISITALVYFLNRDIWLESIYTFDFNNRQVGARIQKDGGLPYLYRWKEGDTPRYYCFPMHPDFSQITATPFFHRLLYPIADLTHRQASIIWLIVEYLMYIVCLLIALRIAVTRWQTYSVLIVFILFPFTNAWQFHISAGQYYLLIPFLLLIITYILTLKKSIPNALIAGLCAISLIMIRPNSLIFFLPFLLLLKRLPLNYILSFLIPAILALVLTLTSKHERDLWLNYNEGMKMQLYRHENHEKDTFTVETVHRFAVENGWKIESFKNDPRDNSVLLRSENGNFFVVFEKFTGIRLTAPQLLILFLITTVSLFGYYLIKVKNKAEPDILNLAILGSLLYMMSDLFSPVFRAQYYTVQWLFPLFIMAATFEKRSLLPSVLALIGILMNILNASWIKMEHTIGEYLMLIALLMIVMTPKHKIPA